MQKKFIAACLGIAALTALAIASAASASPVLTNAKGEAVPVGTEIKASAVGNAVFTASGFNLTCSKAEGSGVVTKNSGTKIAGEMPAGGLKISGTGTGGDCTSGLGPVAVTVNSKLCGETIAGTDEAIGTGCGANITFTFNVTGLGACGYSTASMRGTFLTAPSDAQGTISEQAASKESGGVFCPSSGKLDVSLAESINTGETLSVS